MNLRRRLLAAFGVLMLLMAGAMPGCGGGVGTGGTGDGHAFVSGSVTGFGSVFVNGIRFDDSSAVVEDGDDGRRGSGDLRLGMTVEVESGPIQAGAAGSSATATRIRFDSALLGPVQSIDPAGPAFTVLGQRVTVDDTTVFDDNLPFRLASLGVDQVVEVYAALDAAQLRYRATRVELRAGSAPAYRLRGPVVQVDAAVRLLRIGNEIYSYAGALNVPAGLAPGQFVRLTLQPALVQGRFAVRSFGTLLRAIGEVDDGRLKGLITAFASSTSFEVDGRPVDAGGAPAVAGLGLGVRVEVEGPVRGGVLRARAVTIRTDADERERGFELRGNVESVNAVQRTFVLRGLNIGTGRSDLRYEPGGTGFADLAPGRRVEVRAVLSPGGGSPLDATRIKFD
jgi:hypothetical protein